MKIKWESNSRAKALVSEGKIKSEDIIPRTTTDNFPTNAVTVRMAQLSKKVPFITLHVRGNPMQTKGWNGVMVARANTLRVNMGGDWYGKNGVKGVSGELDNSISFDEVGRAAAKVADLLDAE